MRSRAPVVVLSLVLVLLFLVSLPGFGVETRSFTSYAAWAGPVFLVLTLLVFAGGLGAIGFARRPNRRSPRLAMLAGLAAILTVALDTSAIGGPAPPTKPLVLGIVAAVVGLALVGVAWNDCPEGECPPESSPPATAGTDPTPPR